MSVTLAEGGERRAARPDFVIDRTMVVGNFQRRREAEAVRPGCELTGHDLTPVRRYSCVNTVALPATPSHAGRPRER